MIFVNKINHYSKNHCFLVKMIDNFNLAVIWLKNEKYIFGISKAFHKGPDNYARLRVTIVLMILSQLLILVKLSTN